MGSRRGSVHRLRPRGLLETLRRCCWHHYSSSTLALSNSVGASREAQDSYNKEGMVVTSRRRFEDGKRLSIARFVQL